MGPVKVKKNPEALSLYKSEFRNAFNRDPICAGCGFTQGAQDWKAFERLVRGDDIESIVNNFIHLQNMNKSFKIKNPLKIHKYSVEKNGRLIWNKAYGDVMEEDFAVAYLENATDEEFEIRKNDFITLPKKFRASEEEIEAEKLLKESKKADKKNKNADSGKVKDVEKTKTDAGDSDKGAEGSDAGKSEGGDPPVKTLNDFKLRELQLVTGAYPEEEIKPLKSIASLAEYLAGKGVKVEDVEDAIMQA